MNFYGWWIVYYGVVVKFKCGEMECVKVIYKLIFFCCDISSVSIKFNFDCFVVGDVKVLNIDQMFVLFECYVFLFDYVN